MRNANIQLFVVEADFHYIACDILKCVFVTVTSEFDYNFIDACSRVHLTITQNWQAISWVNADPVFILYMRRLVFICTCIHIVHSISLQTLPRWTWSLPLQFITSVYSQIPFCCQQLVFAHIAVWLLLESLSWSPPILHKSMQLIKDQAGLSLALSKLSNIFSGNLCIAEILLLFIFARACAKRRYSISTTPIVVVQQSMMGYCNGSGHRHNRFGVWNILTCRCVHVNFR